MRAHFAVRALMAVSIGLIGLGMLGPTGASAQSLWTLTPSLNVSERFDDNIRLTVDNRKTDFITEITPGVTLKLDQPVLALSAGYSITGQLYANNSDFDNFGDNQSGFLSASYKASQRLTLGVSGYYARTSQAETFLRPPTVPQGVTVTTLPTVVTGNNVVNQGTLNASAGYQFDSTTSGTATYSFAATESAPASGTLDTSHTVGLGITRQLTAIDQATVTVGAGLFDTNETISTYSVSVGWGRQWTPSLNTNVALGPQVTDGHWNPAGTISLSYRVERQLIVLLTLTQGTSLVVGGSELQTASILSGIVNYQASRAFQLAGFAYVQRTTPFNDVTSSDATTTYAVGVSATYQVTSWMTTYLRYQFTLQEGGVGSTGNIPDNQVILGLSFSYPFMF